MYEYDWKDLIEEYAVWRWRIYESKRKQDQLYHVPHYKRRKSAFRLYTLPVDIRARFSSFAGLPYVISVKDMDKLENNFIRNI